MKIVQRKASSFGDVWEVASIVEPGRFGSKPIVNVMYTGTYEATMGFVLGWKAREATK